MGKKVKSSKKETTKSEKVAVKKVEAPAVAVVEEPEHSDKVLKKIENAKLMQKQIKNLKARVLQTLEVKQVAKAVKAL